VQQQRRGFTLVELLVVIAIIGVLVALLLPAVQAAREAARRTQCGNQLKQHAIAMHNYHDTFGTFPMAASHGGPADAWGATSGLVWLRACLPFIEQNNLYDRWDYTKDYYQGTDNVNLTIIRTPLKAHMCPSDSPAKTWNSTPNYNYAVNLGATDRSRTATSTLDSNAKFQGAPFESFSKRAYSMAAITDGTSNTLMLSEVRQGQVGSDLRGLIWYGSHTGFNAVYAPNSKNPDVLAAGFCNDPGNRPLGLPCTGGSPEMFSSRSRHPGGVQSALCDASVRFVPQTIDILVWRNLSSSQDGNAIGDF
jgi:prepilin-type N-terminal cleavage/methylation domain-containing protein